MCIRDRELKLEQYQNRALRAMRGVHATVDHVNNATLRELTSVPSIETRLVRLRLQWWRRVFANPNETRLVRYTVFGELWGEGSTYVSARRRQLLYDLKLLRAVPASAVSFFAYEEARRWLERE